MLDFIGFEMLNSWNGETFTKSQCQHKLKSVIAAYAYGFENDAVMSDSDFDDLAMSINPKIETGNVLLDDLFIKDLYEKYFVL
jgi:hypothetical protein